MLKYINELDQKLLLYLNSKHTPLWDEIMIQATDRFFWIPFYILIGIFLIWKFKKKAALLLVVIALLVIVSDLFASSLMKPLFERLRPCYNEAIKDMILAINGCGGRYGFISSHSANTFALSTFLILLLKERYKVIYLLYLWASLVSYSRIYLGVHYPGDILGGAVAGIFFAFIFYRIYKRVEFKLFTD